MTDRRFHQGQQVTWKDASGQRYRGRVVEHQAAEVDQATGATKDKGVLVMIDGSPHVSLVPPADLANDDAARAGRKPARKA